MKLVGLLLIVAFLLVFFSIPLWMGLLEPSPPHGSTAIVPLSLDLVAALCALLGLRLRNDHLRDTATK